MLKRIAILIISVLILPISSTALDPIALKGDRILVNHSNQYEIIGAVSTEKNIRKIPNEVFKDSIVMLMYLFNPENNDKYVIVEVANPLLYYVKLSSNDGSVLTGRYMRNNLADVERVNQFRNFRFNVCIESNDTLRLTLITKSANYYQPIPIIIWNDPPLKVDAKSALALGIMYGALMTILGALVLLIFFVNIRIVSFGKVYVIASILFIGYHLGFVYNAILDFKFDIVYHTTLTGLQIVFSELLIWQYLKSYHWHLFLKHAKKLFLVIITTHVLITCVSIFAAFRVDINIGFYKQMQFLLGVSALIVFIPFIYLGSKFYKKITLKLYIYLAALIPFSWYGLMYLFQGFNLIPYQFKIFKRDIINVTPINIILPQLYIYSYFLFLIVILILLFLYYQNLDVQRKNFEVLTARANEEASLSLIVADQEQRTRLSQALHDNVGILLSLLKVKIASLESENKTKLTNCVNEVMQSVRDTAQEISPGALKYVDLSEYLEDYIWRLRSQHSIVDIQMVNIDLLANIDVEKRGQVYRMILSILPDEMELVNYKKLTIRVEKINESIEIGTQHSLIEGDIDFKSKFDKKIDRVKHVIEAYEGKKPIMHNITVNEHSILLILQNKYFFS